MRIVAVVWRFLAASCVALSCCAPATTAFDGVYQGAGQLNQTGLRCDPTIRLDPLTVTEGHAQLGRVTGSVRPNGQLHMTYEGIVVTGQFQGNQFRGTAWYPPELAVQLSGGDEPGQLTGASWRRL